MDNNEKKINRNQNYKVFLEIFGLFFLSIILCFGLYYKQEKVGKIDSVNSIECGNGYECQLDCVDISDKDIIIQGWAYKKDENTQYFDTKVILKYLDADEYYEIATAFQCRPDVTEIKGEGKFEYGNSGFFSRVQKTKLPKGQYEILINYNQHSDNVFIATGYMLEI